MFYPIAIEIGGPDQAFGVEVPDIPGCFSAGDTMDEAIANAREAIDGHLAILADDNAEIPIASTVEHYLRHPDFAGRIWAVVEVDLARYLGKAEKVNVTLPVRLTHRIDRYVARHPQYSRSGFLAEAALEKLAADA
ncbi:type II toxin-antitoxin system HicB family antitoxin [Chitiniphilus shinanonensis]|uniref:type II toxin-antitoxin system HicB family antitoxin n=1 Tax=Chitiniphilus shinanonensis TaxID=553088 RepID=UPI0030585FDD